MPIVINGGIADIAEAARHLEHVDGVMLGRAAYERPDLLLAVDPEIFGEPAPAADAREVIERLTPYIERALASGARLHDVTRHVLGLFNGRPGARAFRRHLSTEAIRPGADAAALREALAKVLDTSIDATRNAAA
jgi:tRNA-dihydrouridine synthase A